MEGGLDQPHLSLMAFDVDKPEPERLREIWSAGEARRKKSAELDQFWNEDWKDLLEEALRAQFQSEDTYENVKLFADTTLNPLKWATQKLGAIYSRSPLRNISTLAEGEAEQALAPYLARGTLDLTLDEACQQVLLHREAFLRPMVVARNKRLEISWDLILPYQVEVVPASDPLAIDAILYSIPVSQMEGSYNYVYWSATKHGTLTSNWEWKREKRKGLIDNPYKTIPVVPLHARFPTRKFWHSTGSNGLKQATLAAGVAMTNLRYLMKMQSFKQLNLSSEPSGKAKDYILDPAYPIITPNGTAQILDWQADLTMQMEVILQQIGAVTNFVGIRPEAVKGTIDASSGYALVVKMQDLIKELGKLERIWTVWEGLLYDTARAVWNVDAPARAKESGLPAAQLPEGDILIEYADVGPSQSPPEQADLMLKYQQLGMSQANIWRELGKDEKWIEKNFEERLEEQSVFGGPMQIPFGTEEEEDDASLEDSEAEGSDAPEAEV